MSQNNYDIVIFSFLNLYFITHNTWEVYISRGKTCYERLATTSTVLISMHMHIKADNFLDISMESSVLSHTTYVYPFTKGY